MLTGCEKEGVCWTNTGSPGFVRRRRSRGYSEIQRPGSYGLSGLKKNGMRFMRQSTSKLLRQDNAAYTGFVLRGCPDISGSGSAASTVQRVRESEAGETPLAGEQSLLHEAVFLLRGEEMPRHEHSGCGQGAETGLTCGQGAGEGVHARAAQAQSRAAPRAIGIDEVSLRKGHTYRIVVSDLERGRPIWFSGEDRSEASMDMFYAWLRPKKTKKIQLAVMDMWKAFTKSTRANAPSAAILYDKFHVMRHLGEDLDKVRKMEYTRLSGKDRSYIKGQKYTLLSNRENLTLDGRIALKRLLKANKRLNTAYLFKGVLWLVMELSN